MSGFETSAPLPTKWRWRQARTLARFRAEIPLLTLPERQTLVDTAIRLLADYYVHLPQKQASHGVDPLARLRALRRRLPLTPGGAGFHAALAEVFDALSDLHTNYLLPAALSHAVAFLPLQLGEYYAGKRRRIIVTRVAPGFDELAPGDEVIAWSGVPIVRALERAASRSPGANPAADDAHALVGMTLRPLAKRPPPDEDWVSIQVRSPAGPKEVRACWRVLVLPAHETRRSASLDVQSDALRRSSRRLFEPTPASPGPAPPTPAPANSGPANSGPSAATLRTTGGATLLRTEIASEEPRNFVAASVRVGRIHVGYLRIPTFVTESADAFVAEFARLLALLPTRGLILDVRDNGGRVVETRSAAFSC